MKIKSLEEWLKERGVNEYTDQKKVNELIKQYQLMDVNQLIIH